MLGDVKKAGSTVKVEKNTAMETEKTDEAQQSRKKTMSEVVQEEPSDSPFATSDEEDEAVSPRSTGDVDEDEFRFFEKGKAGDGKAKSKGNIKGKAGGKSMCAKAKPIGKARKERKRSDKGDKQKKTGKGRKRKREGDNQSRTRLHTHKTDSLGRRSKAMAAPMRKRATNVETHLGA